MEKIAVIGAGILGVNTAYFLSKAVGYLFRIIIFSLDNSFLDKEIFFTFLLSLNIIDWTSIVFAIILQLLLFNAGMNFNKKIIRYSALTVYSGMLLFFFSILLTDVRFTVKAFFNIIDYSNFIEIDNLIPLLTVSGTIFAYFSIVIISFGDFSRYVKNESELKKIRVATLSRSSIYYIGRFVTGFSLSYRFLS